MALNYQDNYLNLTVYNFKCLQLLILCFCDWQQINCVILSVSSGLDHLQWTFSLTILAFFFSMQVDIYL